MRLCDETRAWVRLTRTPGLEIPALAAALADCGCAAALFDAGAERLTRAGLSAEACAQMHHSAAPTARERDWLQAPGSRLIPFTDPAYPPLLRSLPDCPVALYAAGNPLALGGPLLAVVGSRHPTHQGSETAFEFALSLAERGLGVVSGLAEGIDTAAHRGVLAAQGVTLAVLGSGLDTLYPASNRELAALLQHDGLLISEFALGTPPRRGNFPRRNRIIAALSLGVLVVEAARGSGSLITARMARACARPVFAVPGSIHNPLARGCHELIRHGARLVESADDVLKGLDFSPWSGRAAGAAAQAPAAGPNAPGMDKDRKILLDALGFDPANLDTLVVRTGFKPEAVSSMMLILELEGHVQAAPGGRYSRVANRRAGGER